MDNIIIPYVTEERRRLELPEDQRVLLIFDKFKGHLTSAVREKLENNFISFVLVPANMTNIFQPLDVSVNKAAKNVIKKSYSQFYTTEVRDQLTSGVSPHDIKVDLRISILKPKHAQWIVRIFDRFQSDRGAAIIKAGFRRAGITEALEMTSFPAQDPF